MELEEFLEKDIIAFIDSRAEKKQIMGSASDDEYGLYITKDYIKEIAQYLENDELSKAKRSFNELNEKYNALPESSTAKKKVAVILTQVTQLIQKYLSQHPITNPQTNIGSAAPLTASSEAINQNMTINNQMSQNTALNTQTQTNQNTTNPITDQIIEQIYQRAMQEYTQGNREKAIQLWKSIVIHRPNHIPSKIRLQQLGVV